MRPMGEPAPSRCSCGCHQGDIDVLTPRRGLPVVLRCLLGMTWRVAVVMAALASSGAALAMPLLPEVGGLGAGVLLGFWHRRCGLGRLWRWAALGSLLLTPVASLAFGTGYGRLVAVLLVLAAACGLLAGFRRAPVF